MNVYMSFSGPEPGVFKSKHYCLRLHYSVYGQSGYFHMFRSTNTRFFNNMAVPINSEEEAAGTVHINLGNLVLKIVYLKKKYLKKKTLTFLETNLYLYIFHCKLFYYNYKVHIIYG